jgi:hypothetical protein
MNRRLKLFASVMTCACLAQAAHLPALAQSSDSSSVDAVATLEAAVIPLNVGGGQSLDFGSIRIPNGLVSGNTCSYYLGGDVTTQTLLRELNAGGTIVDSDFPTPSGCQLSGAAVAARFDVTCSAATTQISASWSSAGATGVTFRRPDNTNRNLIAAATDGGNAASMFQNTITDSMTITCPNNGAVDIYVGGEVVLGTGATAGTNVTVGTITLSANY